MSTIHVFDERSDRPLRSTIGTLLRESEWADIALARVRLAHLDLTRDEVTGPTRCRVLLGQLDASTLVDAAAGPPATGPAFRRLATWLASDRLEVRSAGIGAWSPDFSIYGGRGRATCLLGAHYFGSPQLSVGPSVTALLEDPVAVRLLTGRFQELWDRAHDVGPAIADVLRTAMARADKVDGGG